MLFPTTLVGSYPQPDWLIDREKLAGRFPPRVRARELWRVPEPWLAQAQDDATVLAIRAQEQAGLDIITDGEIRRESYSNRFATALEGVDIDNPGTALDRSGHPESGAARRRPDPPQARGAGRRSAVPEAAHAAPGEGDGARSVHDGAAGADRLLRRQPRARRARLRSGSERGNSRPVRARRGHRADRRAVHAGAAGRGARLWAQGAQSRARRRERHGRRAHLLRLRRDHSSAAVGLLVPAGAGAVQLRAGVDRNGAVESRLLRAQRACAARRSCSA